MNKPAIRPRPDQISALTKEVSLPLPEVRTEYLKIIAECLHRAYHDILIRYPRTVEFNNEPEITALMESSLCSLIDQDPFWGQIVYLVARGKETLSFDGSHLEKRPDLSIYLTDRKRNFPLIVEAKIIDAKTDKRVKHYCNEEGIGRFVKGEYAWGTREAFMVAYVRDDSTIEAKLTPYLLRAMAREPSAYLVEELPSPVGENALDLARSRHGRAFSYTHQAPPQNVPGPIALWHLWLS